MLEDNTKLNNSPVDEAEISGKVNQFTVGYKDKSAGRVEIEADLCKGCLLCIEACPPGVLVVSKSLNKIGYRPAEYLGEKCTGCGICFYICPEPGSIRVYKRKKSKVA